MKKLALLIPILIVSYEISIYLSNDMYLPAVPEMMQDLQLTLSQAQLTLTMWFIGSAITPLFMGILSDRYGRKSVLVTGGIIFIAATILVALSINQHMLLIGRFIEGAMISSMFIPGYAYIHESYETNEAIKIIAFMNSITIFAPALGPFFGSIILYISSWRGIFWVIAFWSSISIILLAKWLPETFPIEKRQPINLKIISGQYFRIITNKRFMLLGCILGFIFAGFISWITAGPLLVIENFHYSPMQFGLIQALVFAAYILGTKLVKYWIGRVNADTLIHAGLLVSMGGGLLAFIFAWQFPQSLAIFICTMIIYSFGSALMWAPINRMIIESSNEPMGVRMALFTVFITVFVVMGSVISSIFFNGTIFSIAASIAIVSVIGYLLTLIK